MAKMDADLSPIEDALKEIGASWEGVAKAGLWEGAREMKKALIAEIDSLPTLSDRYYFGRMIPMTGLRETEKKGLKEGVRIFKFERGSGNVSVGIGFRGYNDRGKPNVLIARSLVKGTSISKRNQFVAKAFRSGESKRKKAMIDKINSLKTKG